MVCAAMILGAFFMSMCLLGAAWLRRRSAGVSAVNKKHKAERTVFCEQEKEAHYMRNFWNYDGSEQQEWDDI